MYGYNASTRTPYMLIPIGAPPFYVCQHSAIGEIMQFRPINILAAGYLRLPRLPLHPLSPEYSLDISINSFLLQLNLTQLLFKESTSAKKIAENTIDSVIETGWQSDPSL